MCRNVRGGWFAQPEHGFDPMSAAAEGTVLQTLDRGLRALALVAESPRPLSIDALAAALGLHRSITYRIVRTLEDHHLIERDAAGLLHGGLRLAALARPVRSSLRVAAAAELARVADELDMTAFLVVADGGEAVTIESAEPSGPGVRVVYQPGNRHPLDRGAPGLALAMTQPATPADRADLAAARTAGWAFTRGEVLDGMAAVAVPVLDSSGASLGAIAVVWPASLPADPPTLAARLQQAALAVSTRVGR
jgi:DNA-binding IclR family transcriptional regulator